MNTPIYNRMLHNLRYFSEQEIREFCKEWLAENGSDDFEENEEHWE